MDKTCNCYLLKFVRLVRWKNINMLVTILNISEKCSLPKLHFQNNKEPMLTLYLHLLAITHMLHDLYNTEILYTFMEKQFFYIIQNHLLIRRVNQIQMRVVKTQVGRRANGLLMIDVSLISVPIKAQIYTHVKNHGINFSSA